VRIPPLLVDVQVVSFADHGHALLLRKGELDELPREVVQEEVDFTPRQFIDLPVLLVFSSSFLIIPPSTFMGYYPCCTQLILNNLAFIARACISFCIC